MGRYAFERKEEFIEKLRELVQGGVPPSRLEVKMPYPVGAALELLDPRPSIVRLFALAGALLGLFTGFAFTIYTVKVWPLISGGKPFVSIPAFLIIAFALTILFGSLLSFLGFLLASRLPGLRSIVSGEEFSELFEIVVKGSDR